MCCHFETLTYAWICVPWQRSLIFLRCNGECCPAGFLSYRTNQPQNSVLRFTTSWKFTAAQLTLWWFCCSIVIEAIWIKMILSSTATKLRRLTRCWLIAAEICALISSNIPQKMSDVFCLPIVYSQSNSEGDSHRPNPTSKCSTASLPNWQNFQI